MNGQERTDDPWWSYTQGCAVALSRGVEPPVVATHGPLLQPNEVTRLSAPAHYSRLVGGDGGFDRAGAPFFVNPLLMAGAMRDACRAGRAAWLAGRIPKKLYATASSPETGLIGT